MSSYNRHLGCILTNFKHKIPQLLTIYVKYTVFHTVILSFIVPFLVIKTIYFLRQHYYRALSFIH